MEFRREVLGRLSYPVAYNDPDSPDDLRFVQVDLNCSDAHLKREFNEWLDIQRRMSPSATPDKPFTDADFREWHRLAVLPYFDITAIQEIEGKKRPTYPAIAHRIFPPDIGDIDEVDTVERTRKVTKKIGKALFSYEGVSQLKLQAASSVIKKAE